MAGNKTAISIRLNPEIIAYFKAQGPGYQSRINAVLKDYVRLKRCQEEGRADCPEGMDWR